MTKETLYGEDLREAKQERERWLSSMGRHEGDVSQDEAGAEYVISTASDDIKVFLPATLQHLLD